MNSSLDEARRRRRRPIEVEIRAIDEPAGGDSERHLADRDLVERALVRLDPEHRALVVLHHYLGSKIWSPDGSRVVMRSNNTKQPFSIDPVSGNYEPLPWTNELPDWQRVAR